VARCCPATNDLMTPAISLCLWTLIKGSRLRSLGSGCKLKKASGYEGELSVPVSPSISTGSDGAVGSMKSGSLSYSYSCARYIPGTTVSTEPFDLIVQIPKNGTQAGGASRASEVFDLDVALATLKVPVVPTPSTPTCSGRASTSAAVAFRRYLNSPVRDVNLLRSSNTRCSHIPSLCQ
jgi:hypothetical protein